jgi:hypothetical protein
MRAWTCHRQPPPLVGKQAAGGVSEHFGLSVPRRGSSFVRVVAEDEHSGSVAFGKRPERRGDSRVGRVEAGLLAVTAKG